MAKGITGRADRASASSGSFLRRAVAHFTVGELHALVRFYSSSDGQGVMNKILAFTRDLEREATAAVDAEIRASAPPPA